MAELYKGSVRHARSEPALHAFSYDVCMTLVDLEGINAALSGMWPLAGVNCRGAMVTFNEYDHMKNWRRSGQSLSGCVREVVTMATGSCPSPTSKIQLLTHLQYFGYCFNPISVYYVYDVTNTRVETVIAEVSNTPWMEMHLYILSPGAPGVHAAWTSVTDGSVITDEQLVRLAAAPSATQQLASSPAAVLPSLDRRRAGSASRSSSAKRRRSSTTGTASVTDTSTPSSSKGAASYPPSFLPPGSKLLHYSWKKDFHVSPFMGLDQEYHWAFSEPSALIFIRSVNTRDGDGRKLFTTQLRLTRLEGPLTAAQVAWTVLVAFPLLTWRLQWWIHYEAVRLFRKGVPLYPHPTGATNGLTDFVESIVHAVQGLLALLSCCSRSKAA